MNANRGDVVLAWYPFASGQGAKRRPCMVVQNDIDNAKLSNTGVAYRVDIPALTVPQCGNCQAISIDDEADHQIIAAFRREAKLLAPEAIREGRETLALTQKQFANLLGAGEATLSLGHRGADSATRDGPLPPPLPRQPTGG